MGRRQHLPRRPRPVAAAPAMSLRCCALASVSAVANAPISVRSMSRSCAASASRPAIFTGLSRRALEVWLQEPRHGLRRRCTKAQHCRGRGLARRLWLGRDRPGGRSQGRAGGAAEGNNTVDSLRWSPARQVLFGAWEATGRLRYRAVISRCRARSTRSASWMYPQAEVAGALLDCLDPDTFEYSIKSAEITA